MKRKQKTLRQLKEQAWTLFSQVVRRSAADEGGTVECYTCRKLMFWKDAHAGHFVPGRTNAVLLNPEVVRPQCPVCNIWRGGAYHDYTLRMIDEVGRQKVNELMALRHQTVKFTRSDLIEKIEHYKAKLEALT